MKNLDDAIKDALGQEDAEFLAKLDEEPGTFRQVADIFQGPLNWVYVILLITAVLLGIFGVYSVWRFGLATEMRPLFHWGALAGFCLVVLAVVRVLFFMQIHTNRILREVKRLELQVALLTRQRP